MVLNCFCWNPESFWKRGPRSFAPVFRCQHFPAFFLPQVLHSSFFPDNVLQKTVFCLLVSSMLRLPEVVCLLASFASLSIFKRAFTLSYPIKADSSATKVEKVSAYVFSL